MLSFLLSFLPSVIFLESVQAMSADVSLLKQKKISLWHFFSSSIRSPSLINEVSIDSLLSLELMDMLTTMSFPLCLLLFLFTTTQCQWTLRQYLIEKDFFNGFKAGEFSIYDLSTNRLLYRFETRYAFTQMADLLAEPNQQKVATIQHIWSPWRKYWRREIDDRTVRL